MIGYTTLKIVEKSIYMNVIQELQSCIAGGFRPEDIAGFIDSMYCTYLFNIVYVPL